MADSSLLSKKNFIDFEERELWLHHGNQFKEVNLKRLKRKFCPLNLLIAISASFKLCNAIT
jgi:hypothetical protein